MHKNGTTDVLAFNLSDEFDTHHWGDVFINFEKLPEQAYRYHVTPQAELLRLVAHGVYHLLGNDDQTLQQQKKMRQLENDVLKIFIEKS